MYSSTSLPSECAPASGDVARKKGAWLGRRYSRSRRALLVGALTLAVYPFPKFSLPVQASPGRARASGRIVANEVVHVLPARSIGELTRPAAGLIGIDAGSTGPSVLLFTSPVVDARQLFDFVGVHWTVARGAEDSMYVELRASRDGSSWNDWTAVTHHEDMRDEDRNELFAGPFGVSASRFAQYRVWLTGGDPDAIGQFALTFMDVSDLNASPVARVLDGLRGTFAGMWSAEAAAAPVGASKILTRQDWGADENLMQWPARYQRVQKAIVHHTVTSDGGSDVAAAIRSIYYFHAVTRGWGDIGYNYIVDKFGNIWTGRQGGDHAIAGHAYGWNNGTIGIAALGDYSSAQPTSPLQGAIANIIAMKFAQLGLQPFGAEVFVHQEENSSGQWSNVMSSPPNIIGHRDANYIQSQTGGQTACPGNGIYNMLDGLRRLAQSATQNGFTNLAYIDGNLPKAGFPGAVLQVPLTVANRGMTQIPAGTTVSYRILKSGNIVVPQGGAATLQAAVAPGSVGTVNVPFSVPVIGNYIARWDLQTNGQWWNSLYGNPVRDQAFRAADWSADWVTDTVPISWVAGEQRVVTVTVLNDGGRTWPAIGTNPVRLGYKWVSNATGNQFPGANFSSLPADVAPGQQVTLAISITAPPYPTNYTLYLDLYKQNEFAFADKGVAPDDTPTGVSVDFKAGYLVTPTNFTAGQVATVPVVITNLGKGTFPVSNSFPVNLGYHWYSSAGQTVAWDGARTKLPADLLAGQSVQVQAQVTAPQTGGSYRLAFDLVQEGVGWFSGKGVQPSSLAIGVQGPVVASYGATYEPGVTTLAMSGEKASVPITVKNTSNFAWLAAGANPVTLSYHWSSPTGQTIVWDGLRTKLPSDVVPGASVQLQASIAFPSTPGQYTLRWDLAHEGVSWFSGKGVKTFDQPVSVSPAQQLFYGGSIDASRTPTTMAIAMVAAVPLRVQNLSNFDFGADVNLSYHWYDSSGKTVMWDGMRTSLAGLKQGEVRSVTAQVQVPAVAGQYTLKWDVVREGVTWFSSQGMQIPAYAVKVDVPQYGAQYIVPPSAAGQAGGIVSVPVTLMNTGSQTWIGGQYNLSYHIYRASGEVLVWDGMRTALPGAVGTGQNASLQAQVRLPAEAGSYVIRFDIVVEGVLWFSGTGVPAGSVTLTAQ